MEIRLIIKLWHHYKVLPVVFFLFLISCSSQNDEAQDIVDKCIAVHGGENYKNVIINFNFRDRNYTALRRNGKYAYTREFEDSLGRVKDILDNNGFTRYINDNEVKLSDEWERNFSNSVNGVIYFALLPYPLNDPAVKKNLLGEDTIKGAPYYKIKVTFSQGGGGEDYNDNFIYWIHKQNFTMDYLAYDYETNGGGSRFREAINPRREGGILFLDFNNYEPTEKAKLEDYDLLFEKGNVKEVSVIHLENIKVNPI
jgi:hypothetical protein